MRRRSQRSLVRFSLALFFIPASTLPAQEITGKFTVLIPDFAPQSDAARKFGENAAEALRTRMNTLMTHEAVSRKDMDKTLKGLKVDRESLDCITGRQLAAQMGSQVAVCATYAPDGDGFRVEAEVWDIASSEMLAISPTRVPANGADAAAGHIFGEFDRYIQQIRAAGICREYAASSQWNEALANCDRALELNPKAVATRYQRAFVLYQADRYPEALTELQRVLEQDPVHQDALQLAGYVAAVEGLEDEALVYYDRYLALNPGSAAVRMKIAYELAQAGDPAGAAQLIEVGLDQDPENIDLWEQLGGFAFAAGQRINEEQKQTGNDAGGLAPAAVEYYRQAIDAYQRVYVAKGPETPAGELRSIVAALVQLGEAAEAVAMAEEVVKTHAEDPGLWSTYGDALQRAGRLPDAIRALERVRAMDPAYPNLDLRQAKWLMDAGRVTEGVEVLKGLAAADPSQADAAGRMVLADAYAKGVQPKKWGVSEASLTAARAIPNLSTGMRQQIDFWLGWSIFQAAVTQQEPRTVETAQATLPRFLRARELFGSAGDYPATVNVDMAQLTQNINTFIEIQESIIKRGE
ncbi:MAG TPA: tetratricopeptide repeat protein [Longimicrobiales bacterium]|nr:tetratricopeptide repeat protein [Longimicrobiales bacterium]